MKIKLWALLTEAWSPRVILSFILSLSFSFLFRLIPWSTEALWVHFPAWASKTLSRRCSLPLPHREGAWGLREQSKSHAGALLAFCVNQGISASFSLLYFLIGWLRTTRFWSIKEPQHSILPFSSHLQSFPASGSFTVSQFFPSGGQNIGASATASVFPMNIQDWFPLGLTGWITLQPKRLSRVFSNTTVQKYKFFGAQLSSNSHIHTWLLEKP